MSSVAGAFASINTGEYRKRIVEGRVHLAVTYARAKYSGDKLIMTATDVASDEGFQTSTLKE
jgi:hypothetical protein